ncbi:hypothetical protein KI387_042619, partial [Taxus chinensis]
AHEEVVIMVHAHTHMDEIDFDVCEESCISRRLKKTPQARHMTVKPTIMSNEQ